VRSCQARKIGWLIGISGLAVSLGAASSAATAPTTVAWRLAWRANLPYGNVLVSATATGSANIWAVGSSENGSGGAYIVHWNGHKWRMSRFPNSRFVPGVVRASSPTNVWVEGWTRDNPGVAYRWNGSKWLPKSLPRNGGVDIPFVVLGPSDVWTAVPSQWQRKFGWVSKLWNWNGSAWKSYQLPAGLNPSASIGGSSARNLWVVGTNAPGFNFAGQLVAYRWTGNSWRSMPIPRERIIRTPAVSVSPSGDVWIEATSPRIFDRHHLVIVLHRHDGKWTALRTADTGGQVDWPPTADGRTHVWFWSSQYWTGRLLVSPTWPARCGGGIFAPNIFDMAAIPRTSATLRVASCSRSLNSGLPQGIVMISKVS